MGTPSDGDLLDLVARDPEEGIARIVDRYGEQLRGRLWRQAAVRKYGNTNVDGIFQEAILRLLDPECRAQLLAAGGGILPWLSRWGYWRLDDAGRRAHDPLPEHSSSLNPSHQENPRSDSPSAAVMALREVFPLLPPRDRDILRWRYEESLTTSQVAERLGISEAATKKAAHDARERLRKVLAEAGMTLE